METWLTVDDVAGRLRVHERTIRRWIEAGRLPATNLGGRAGYRIAETDLLAFMKADTPPPTPEKEEER